MSDEEIASTPLALPVLGLSDGGERAKGLEKLLRKLTGVVKAYVSPHTGLAYVDYDPAVLTEDQIVGAISGAGYSLDETGRRFAWRRH
ncbi:MAG TPA: cation transporter [Dehalococcoidia bacterium]